MVDDNNKGVEEKALVFCQGCDHGRPDILQPIGCYHPDVIEYVNTPYMKELRHGNINELNKKNDCRRFSKS